MSNTLKRAYLTMRNTQNLDANFLYLYYKDKRGTATKGVFMQAANMYEFNSLYEKLDSEFSINILFDKNGEFVKAYE